MMHAGIRIAVVLACVGLGVTAQAQQLKNPSFEESKDRKKPHFEEAADWGRWGAYINRHDDWDTPHNGRCMLAYHHWQIFDNETSGVYQDVEKAEAGATYEFSIYAFVDKDANADHIELRIEKLWGNGSVSAEKIYFGSIKSGSWERLSVRGTPEDAGFRVTLVVAPAKDKARSGSIKFDDAKIRKVK